MGRRSELSDLVLAYFKRTKVKTLRRIIADDEQIGIDSPKLLVDKYTSDLKVVAASTEAGIANSAH